MEKLAEARAVPSLLDLNLWLSYCLASPDEVDRRLALDEIGFQGLTDAFNEDLQRLTTGDPTKACRDFASQLLSGANKSRTDGVVEKIELSPERTRTLLELGEDTLQRIVQLSLRKAPSNEVLQDWRSHLLGEENPEVIRVGLTLLAKFGVASDAGLALPFASHASVPVVKAAIDLIHTQSLDQFKERIAQFLMANDLEIRLHAIRKLRTIDPHESRKFLRSLLAARNPFIRQRALRELMLLPFKESEALYLSYLSVEPLPLLLVLAGSAVTMNPVEDLPQKLYDIFFVARGRKAIIAQLIINQVLGAIQASGILKESVESYISSLKSSLQKRKLWITCQMALKDLEHSEAEVRLVAVGKLRQGLGFPKVVEALERRDSVETDQEVREALANALGREKESFSPAGLRQKVQDGSFYSLDPKVQRKFLATIVDEDSFGEVRTTLSILLVAALDRSVLLQLFDRIYSHGRGMDLKPLNPYLKNPDPAILAGAVRATGKIDLDAISYEIPNLLRHDDFRVKMAALELYLVSDKPSALQYLVGMLKSQQIKVRENGLSLLAMVDYPSAEQILREYFPAEKDIEAQLQAGFILAANPSLQGIQLLYNACHDSKGVLIPDFQDLWESALEGAVPMLAADIAGLETICRGNQVQEKERAAADKLPSYAFRKVSASTNKDLYAERDQLLGQPSTEIQIPDIKGSIEKAAGFFGRHQMQLGATFLAFVCVGLWMLSSDSFHPSGPGTRGGVTHETHASRMEEGEANKPSMVMGQRGNTSHFISGSSYARNMKAMEGERQSISEEFHRKSQDALNDTLMQMADDPNYKGYAEFYLNENCRRGLEALEKGNMPEAKDSLLKALADPGISEEARMLVSQSLMGVGFEVGDKAAIEKAMDALLATIPDSEMPKGYDRMKIKEAFSGLDRIKEVTPEQFAQVMQKMAQQNPGKIPPGMRQKMIDGFAKMQNRFK